MADSKETLQSQILEQLQKLNQLIGQLMQADDQSSAKEFNVEVIKAVASDCMTDPPAEVAADASATLPMIVTPDVSNPAEACLVSNSVSVAPLKPTSTSTSIPPSTKPQSSSTLDGISQPMQPTLKIPMAIMSYIKADNEPTNSQVSQICAPGFATADKDYVIDDGMRPGIQHAVCYSFLMATQTRRDPTNIGNGMHSPMFIDLKLNNAQVNNSKELYEDLWRQIPNQKYPAMPVGFFKGYMTREETEKALGKKPQIIVITPGKLMDLLERKLRLDLTYKICFDQLNALILYNREDKPIQEILSRLRVNNHIIAFTTSLSDRLHERFKELTPLGFCRNLKDMMHFNDDRANRLKWLIKHIQFVPTRDSKVPEYPKDKKIHALKCLMDPDTKEKEFGDRPILAICNYKKTIRNLKVDAGGLFEEKLPIFHGGEDLNDDERWSNFHDFEDGDINHLVCTRRSMYGCRFKFLPAFLVVEFPKSFDEWLHIAQWYLSLCEDAGIDFPDTHEPCCKFLYEVDDNDDYNRVRYVLAELKCLGIASLDMPHKLHPKHQRSFFDF